MSIGENMQINEELKCLIPPLAPDEYKILEKSVIAEGCRDPLILWGDTIVDGHNRYAICNEHGITYKTSVMDFDDIDTAKIWMIDNQRGRRNLSKQVLLDLGMKRAALLEEMAKEKEHERKTTFQKSEKSDLPTFNTTKEMADYAGVSVDTASKYKQVILSDEDDVKELLKSGNISINKAYETIKRPHVANNSGENEWYTPPRFIESARKVMGSIDTDPASSNIANKTVNAKMYFTKEDDGLSKKWEGNVWMNPPYSQPEIKQFSHAVSDKYDSGEIASACVLVNNATETGWFSRMLKSCTSVCFPSSRIKFIDMEGKPSGAPLQGQAIIYFGDNPADFAAEFSQYGPVLIHAW